MPLTQLQAGSRSAAQDPSKLSHHVHRVGYHFRTDVFDEACNKLGYCTRNGKLEKIEGASRLDKAMFRYGSRFDLIDINNHSEEESQKVKKFIRELFPKIPEADLEAIYKRAWEQVRLDTLRNCRDNLGCPNARHRATGVRVVGFAINGTTIDQVLRIITYTQLTHFQREPRR